MNIFQKLSNSYAICVGERLLVGVGFYGIGAVASVVPDEKVGMAFIEEQKEAIESLKLGTPRLERVGDSWKFMRKAAGEGLAGIEGANPGMFPERFMFMVRVDEAGEELPTVLAAYKDGWGDCLTRTGIKGLLHAELLHWQRFDILDHVTSRFGQRCPFRSWKHGDPLFELRSEKVVLLLSDVPLLGDWNSTEGAVAFFTEEEAAKHYLMHHLSDGRNRMLAAPEASGEPEEMMAGLRPVPVADILDRLGELAETQPFAAWCINPEGHREDSAYGRLLENWPHAVGVKGAKADRAPRIATVAGIWKVLKGNAFELEKPFEAWSGRDTIGWSGGQSIQLLPLDRSFATNIVPSDLDIEDMSEGEKEEIVEQSLHVEEEIGPLEEHLANREDDIAERLEQFHIVAWDTVTGDGADFPLRFRSVFQAVRYLAAFERLRDRDFRVEGATSCMHMGFSGSGDAMFEDLRSQRFQLGLRRIALRFVRSGYRPKDADDLVALCNGTLRTLHVDFAGYPKDLLWSSSTKQRDELLEQLEIDEAIWDAWSQSADAEIDPVGKEMAVSRVGEANWSLLQPKSRHFLATALHHLHEQGHAPQLDYAPISLELVKALEVELGNIFAGYRESLGGDVPAYDLANRAQCSLIEFVSGKKPLTLGDMSYIFREQTSTALISSLKSYLAALPNGEFITSKKFVKRGLQRVINKYRNGGAHDSPIRENVCREGVEDI